MTQRVIFTSMAALLVVSANACWDRASAQSGPKRIEIKARRFVFEPADLTLKKGEPVVLVLKSEDVPHGLRFRDLNVAIKAGKGESAEVEFTPDRVGDFTGQCWVFCGAGHGSMMMKLHVVN